MNIIYLLARNGWRRLERRLDLVVCVKASVCIYACVNSCYLHGSMACRIGAVWEVIRANQSPLNHVFLFMRLYIYLCVLTDVFECVLLIVRARQTKIIWLGIKTRANVGLKQSVFTHTCAYKYLYACFKRCMRKGKSRGKRKMNYRMCMFIYVLRVI